MWGPLTENAVILVTGASGGVGVATVQLSHALGYTVIGLSEVWRKANVFNDSALMHAEPGGQKSGVRALEKSPGTQAGVDMAVDNIGGKLLPEVIETR